VQHFDLVIIGAGSGNTVITSEMDDWSIALIEPWVFGGTCLNRGCIPTKMLVHAADSAEAARHSSVLGVDVSVDDIRWLDMRERVFGRIDPIAAGGENYRRTGCGNVTVFGETARFVGPKRLAVGDQVITADRIVIATGARPMIPDISGLAEVGYYTSDDIMRADEVPTHLIVLGGGFIACELAHVFGALGSQVTMIQRSSHLLRSEDADISAAITETFAQRFDLHCDAHVRSVRRVTWSGGESVEVTLDSGKVIVGSHILVATGRVPNSDTLEVGASGIAVHVDGRVVVDSTQATNVDGVWALGDVSSPYMLKHVANHEARVVAHNLKHPESLRHTNYCAVPHAVFTRPQIAAVGMTEAEARAAGLDIVVATQKYGDVAYGWALEDTTSFCKLVADRGTRKLLGAHIIGPQSSSLVQQLIQGMTFGRSIDDMAFGQYYIHPALGEVIENALITLCSQ
jgi:mycothione reductase